MFWKTSKINSNKVDEKSAIDFFQSIFALLYGTGDITGNDCMGDKKYLTSKMFQIINSRFERSSVSSIKEVIDQTKELALYEEHVNNLFLYMTHSDKGIVFRLPDIIKLRAVWDLVQKLVEENKELKERLNTD